MSEPLLDLLQDILDFLSSRSSWPSLGSRHRRRRRLIDRLTAMLAEQGNSIRLEEFVALARREWAHLPGVRIEDDALVRADEGGLWVAAWILVAPVEPDFATDALAEALSALPVRQRYIFRLYRVEGLDLPTIGKRLDMTAADVRSELAAALTSLHAAQRKTTG